MGDLLTWLGDKWEIVGWGGQIIIVLFIVLIIFTTIRPFVVDFLTIINDMFKGISRPFKNKNKTKTKETEDIDDGKKTKHEIIEDVENHGLMNEINEIKIKLNSLNFGDKNRDKIFKLILNTQMDTIQKYVMKLVNTYNVDELDRNKFVRLITEMLSDIITETETKLELELGHDIYDLVMNQPGKGLRTWTKNNDERTWKLIEEFCKVDYIQYNHDRLLFILMSLSTSISVIYSGIEKRFFEFNGELSNLIEKAGWN